MVKRTLRPGLGLAERSPRPPFGGWGGGVGKTRCWGLGKKHAGCGWNLICAGI